MNAEYKDLVYHTEEVLQFLKNEPQKFEELESESWNHNLFFLCDITFHLNDFNTQPQGKKTANISVGRSSKSFQNETTTFQKSVVEW